MYRKDMEKTERGRKKEKRKEEIFLGKLKEWRIKYKKNR
jgi:hypothetical protein